MFEVIFLSVLAILWIIFAVIQDLKKREVPNWLNFSLIIFALGFRFFYSLFSGENFSFFFQGLIGFGIFLVLGNLFYYARMFAGGDAKLLISLGAVLPFSDKFMVNLEFFLLFFVLFFFAGAVYSIGASIFLTVKNYGKFKKEIRNQAKKNKILLYAVMFFGLALMSIGFSEKIFFFIGILVFLLPYFYVYVKAVDESCMVKKIRTAELREGDWLYRNVRVGRRIIKARWEGLSKEEIRLIRKKYRQIVIRQGVPFAPVFLITFLIYVSLWKSFG